MSERVFSCAMCGKCCQGAGGIILAEHDLERLCRGLDLTPEAFEEAWAERAVGRLRLRTGPDGACVFFKGEAGCGVHPHRPDVCRAWPFFRGNLLDASSFELAKEDCRGIAREAQHADFVRLGLEYLRGNGLARNDEDSPNALNVSGISVPETGP